MAKGSSRTSTNLLRLSGILFTLMGTYHALTYLLKRRIELIELSPMGSLLVGIALFALAFSCFMNSRD